VNKIVLVLLGMISVFSGTRAFGTELKPATAQAFQRYAEFTEARIRREIADPKTFLLPDSLPDAQKNALLSRLKNGEIVAQPMSTREDGSPIPVPGGLVHHWMAIGFIPGATMEQVLKLAQDYSRHAELYKPDVQNAKILSQEGQHFHVYYRFYRHAIVTVLYNTEFDADYFTVDSSRSYCFVHAVHIGEIEDPGKPDEKEYPEGKDHGYMWRLNLYTRYLQRDGGVYIQVEFLALSRTVPAVFAWLVNPYIHSIPRDYLKHYIEETRKALSPAAGQ
jgi:hypothetical protein